MAKGIKPAKRKRTVRNFPASTFSEALEFARGVYRIGSGRPIRRLTLLDELGKSPTSSTARMAITNSSKYGLTKGSYTAEFIELTALGETAVSDAASPRESARAKIEAAILSIPPFKGVYESSLIISSLQNRFQSIKSKNLKWWKTQPRRRWTR